MSLRVAIQMDPVEFINIRSDTSFALGLEAKNAAMNCTIIFPTA